MVRKGQEIGEIRCDIDPAILSVVLLGADVFFFMAEDVFQHFRDVHFAEAPGDCSEALSEILLNEYSAKRDLRYI